MRYCPKCGVELQNRTVDDVSRLACPAVGCKFVHWDNPIPVVAGVVRWRDQYVLARNIDWPPGMFSMITGFLERSEGPEQALRREMKEELGLDLETCVFIGHYSFLQANQLILAFLAEASGDLVTGRDVVEAKTLPIEALVNYDFGPLDLTARVIRDGVRLASNQGVAVGRPTPSQARSFGRR